MPSNTAWARSVSTTIVKHLREEAVEVLRATRFGAMLESKGRVTTNVSGLGFDWPVRYRLSPMAAVTTVLAPNFTPQNKWKRAVLETRGYQATDGITKKEFLENKGTEAIVKVAQKMGPGLTEDLKQQFGREFYIDGNQAGNDNRIHGIESFGGYQGTLDITAAENQTRSANAADIVAWSQDSYAGLNTTLQDAGGNWATAPTANDSGATHWPNGDVDPEYDYWTPVIVNYTSTSLSGGSTHNWKTQGLEAIRFGLLQLQRNMKPGGTQTPVVLIHRNMLKDTLTQLDANQRSIVTNELGLRSFGFKNVFEYDGAEVSADYYVPPNTGYGIDFDSVEMMSMQSDLFSSEGLFWDPNTQSYKCIADFLGNLKFESPRDFFFLKAVA